MAKGRPAAAAGAAHEHAPAAAAETTEEHPRAAAAPKRRRGGCNRCTQVLLAAVATTIVCGSAWVAGNYWLGTNSYLTSAEIVAGSLEARDGNGEAALRAAVGNVTASLTALYGTAITEEDWIFMRAGGWMGAWKLLYASATEYILIFGTGMDTSGHSGRYWADISDTLLSGTFTQWEEGRMVANVHTAGTTVYHPAWSATGVHWTAGTWMVEHATGIIPTTLPFAFADSLLSAQDLPSLGRAVAVYARHILRNALAGRL